MTTSFKTDPVIIIGAGISGLVLGFELQKNKIPVIILEKSPRVGGVIRTISNSGFVCECGPNSTYARDAVQGLIKDLALDSDVVYLNPRTLPKYLVTKQLSMPPGKLAMAPQGLLSFLTSPLLSVFGKLRLLLEPFMRKGDAEDESVASFIQRRFGQELAQRIISPVLSGIWAADINSLSAREAFKKLWQLEKEFGSIAKGMVHSTSAANPSTRRMLSFRWGMESLVNRLGDELKQAIFLNHEIKGVEHVNEQIIVESRELTAQRNTFKQWAGSHVVITTDTVVAGDVLEPFDRALATDIRAIPYAPLGILHVAAKRRDIGHSLEGFGFLVPPEHSTALLGAIFTSSLFPERAPDEMVLLTVFVGGAVNPDRANVQNAEVARLVTMDLRKLLSIESEVQIVNSIFLPRAIPNYPVGHYQLTDRISQFHATHPRIRLLANWYAGLSVADRIEQSTALAAEIISYRDSEGSSQFAASY